MKNICFLIDHPFDLVLFLGLKNLLKKKGIRFKGIVLVTNQSYFEKCKICDKFINEFDDIRRVEKPIVNKDVINNISNSLAFVKSIKEINKLGDVQYIVASRAELTVQLIVKHALFPVVKILQKSIHKTETSRFLEAYNMNIKGTLVRNFYEVFLGLSISISYVSKSSKYIRYIKYRGIESDKSNNDLFLININKRISSNEINFPYYFCNTRSVSKRRKPKMVYYLGNRIFSYEFILDNNIADIINKVLRGIEKYYGDEVEYIYKPHPLEKNDFQNLDLNKFKIIEEDNSAEIEYLKNYSNIEAVYSFGSTSSKTAFNFKINSYVLYKLFNVDPEISSKYDCLFSDLPDSFFITTINNIAPISSERSNYLNIDNLLKDLI
jgi:hypothetical protein